MEGKKHVVRGIAHDTDVAKVVALGVKNAPGRAHRLFQELADKNIIVDMIVQSVQVQNQDKTDMVFSVSESDLVLAQEVLDALQEEGIMESVSIDTNMAKISIVGAGMLGHPGIAASHQAPNPHP